MRVRGDLAGIHNDVESVVGPFRPDSDWPEYVRSMLGEMRSHVTIGIPPKLVELTTGLGGQNELAIREKHLNG